MVFAPFWVWKRVQILPILVWNRVWFTKELRLYINVFAVSIPNESEGKCNRQIRNGFSEIILCRLNLSNDDIICVLCKHVMLGFVTNGRSENGRGKWQLLVGKRVRIWRTGWHTPTKSSQQYPPGLHHSKFADYIIFVRKAEIQYALFTIGKEKICCKHYSATWFRHN